jgi:hypothetical protein
MLQFLELKTLPVARRSLHYSADAAQHKLGAGVVH